MEGDDGLGGHRNLHRTLHAVTFRKSALWGLLALFLCLDAGAATYYVDCDAGNDSNNGSTALLAKLTVGSITIGASDTIYIKAGTTCEEQVSVTVDGVTITNWPTDTDGAQNLASGEASYDPTGKWVIDCANTRQFGIYGRAVSNLSISDGEIKNCTENAVHVTADTAATTDSNIAHARLIAHDIGPGIGAPSGETEYHIGTCFFVRTAYPTVTGTAVLDGVSYTDTVAYNCGKHGYDSRWRVLNVTHTRAIAYHAGVNATGHGFSAHPLFETFTSSGWTDADGAGAGTIYYRDRSSNSNQERRFINSTDSVILTQNTGTPTTPGANEWGMVAAGGGGACAGNATVGCLYVNISGALTGKTFLVKRFAHGPFTYTDCRSYDNGDWLSKNEGHGFSADDLSGPAYYYRSAAYNNYGDGFKTLRGESLVWRGNLSFGNADSGFAITSCTNCEFSNNTADRNAVRGFWDSGVTSVNVDVTNNIGSNDLLRGFSMGAGTVAASGYSDATNISFGNANNACTGVVNCTDAAPLYVGGKRPTTLDGYRLSSNSTLIRAGTCHLATGCTGLDFRGYRGRVKPDIGAYQRNE